MQELEGREDRGLSAMRRFSFVLALATVMTPLIAVATSAAAQQLVTGLDADLTGGGGSNFTTKGPAVGPGGRPGDEEGSGTAHVALIPSENRLCYSLEASDIEPAKKAHIHEGTAEEAGSVVMKLDPPAAERTSSGCTDVKGSLLRNLLEKPHRYYVDVHNEEFPHGAIRGQLSLTEASGFSPACPASVCP
jgi:CHRD domain-containing protein